MYPMEESWDVLIVLDACRYDYFEKVYRDYIPSGNLTKRISPGSWTPEWAARAFTDYYEDCVYISANPFISYTRKLGFNGLRWRFRASDHFLKVFEVWKTHWDDDLGTVRPEAVNRMALEALHQYPDKRLILHYLQPHYPYLTLPEFKTTATAVRIMSWIIKKMTYKVLGSTIGAKLAYLIPGGEESVAKKAGSEVLLRAYEKNLRIVLESVADLSKYFQGKIVITADHGELLGEEGKYGHPEGYRTLPVQIEIPWLELTRPSAASTTGLTSQFTTGPKFVGDADENLVRQRLRALGYE